MGTKTIGLREDVYERLKARKREGESFTDVVDRLIAEEAAELERIATRSRRAAGHGLAERQDRALEVFADVDGERDDDGEGIAPDGS
jgi:predicted CopG family antitoxin